MNYKRQTFIILFILFRLCTYSQNLPGPMEVKYVTFQIETICSIDPFLFDSSFTNREYKFWDLDQHDSGSNLVYSYLTQFKKVRPQSVNTRLKIVYSIKNIERVIWMNKF